MSDTCETVKIQASNEQGFVIINKSDFDEAEHALYVEDATPPAEKPIDATPTVDDAAAVSTGTKKKK